MDRRYKHNFNSSQLKPGALQLKIESLFLRFGGVVVIVDISLNIYQGELVAIIGPNGAGKTSLLNCISGLYHPQEGYIWFFNNERTYELTTIQPYKIARAGVARAFQNIELFKNMSVLDNLMLGRHIHLKSPLWDCLFYWRRAQREEIAHREYIEEVIDLLEIQDIRHKLVGTLPYGLQKRVELGRALALQPALLIIDEPMAGMNLEEKQDMTRFILDINEEYGLTVVLVEHDMGVVMSISDRVIVLDFGRKIGEGTPEQVQRNPAVLQAYLGQSWSE